MKKQIKLKTESYSLYNEDCLKVLTKIPKQSVDLVLTDPPYGAIAAKWDSVIPFDEMWKLLYKVLKPKGKILLFGQEPFSTNLKVSNLKNFKYDLYWKKNKATNFLNAKHSPTRSIEIISVFYSLAGTYNRDKHKNPRSDRSSNKGGGIHRGLSDQLITYKYKSNPDLLEFPKDKENFHPTQKPVALLKELIRIYSNKGETVLDFTMGSGSTGVAAVQMARKFIGIEIDPNYYRIARQRIQGSPVSKQKPKQTNKLF